MLLSKELPEDAVLGPESHHEDCPGSRCQKDSRAQWPEAGPRRSKVATEVSTE